MRKGGGREETRVGRAEGGTDAAGAVNTPREHQGVHELEIQWHLKRIGLLRDLMDQIFWAL